MKIDIYAHIITPKYKATLERYGGAVQLLGRVTSLWDLEHRFRVMDTYRDVIQVLVPTGTPRNITAGQEMELARTCNEEVAEVVARCPDRFIAGVAMIPFKNPEETLREAERAIKDLNFRGVLVPTPIEGKAIDRPELLPLYEMMERYDLPVWVHPARPPVPEYKGEEKSFYDMWMLWSWPYESTLAMTRLVFSQVLQKYPKLKVIIHHAGAMVPFFKGRIANLYESWEITGKDNHKKGLKKEPLDYFRMFYVDTAIGGNSDALTCAYRFYGADQMVFGTDMPYDPANGLQGTPAAIEAINQMGLSESDRQKIFEMNARRLLKISR